MAVTINTYFSERIIEGSRPSVSSVPSSEIPPVVNPPGYPSGHSPVTLATPSNGLTLVGQQLGLGLASSGVTGALSGTKFDEFDSKIGGNIDAGQVAFGTGAGTIGGDSGLIWNNTNKRLETVGGGTRVQDTINQQSVEILAGGVNTIQSLNRTSIIFQPLRYRAIDHRWDNGSGTISMFLSSSNLLGLLTTSPTNTLDVNGTARIRTINNLGTSATVVLTKTATGVISERTLAEFVSDVSPDFDGRYLRKDQNDNTQFGLGLGMTTSIGTNTLLVRSITINQNPFFTLQYPDGSIAVRQYNDGRFQIFNRSGSGRAALEVDGTVGGSIAATFVGVGPTISAIKAVVSVKNSNSADRRTFEIINSSDLRTIELYSEGTIFHSRSSQSDRSVRRDELYLNYSETVATTGTINDLAIDASTKLLILTGADDLTGVVAVDNTRLLRIEARGANRIIRNDSVSSTLANRFSIGSDLTINDGEVYQFIYTNSRWRRVL